MGSLLHMWQLLTMKTILLFLTLIFCLGNCQKTTEPTPCTNANKGHCECGDTSQGFQTYTFWIDDVQRCFTIFHPFSYSKLLPVLITSQCYAKDALQGLQMTNS